MKIEFLKDVILEVKTPLWGTDLVLILKGETREVDFYEVQGGINAEFNDGLTAFIENEAFLYIR